MAFLRHDFSCFFSFLQNSARRSAAYPLRGYCYFSRFLWLFHRLPPMHTKGVRSELPGLFLSRRYWPPSPKPYWLFLSNFPLYRFLSMVIIFVLNSGFPPRSQPRFRPRRDSHFRTLRVLSRPCRAKNAHLLAGSLILRLPGKTRYFLRASTTKYLVSPGTPESFPWG